MYDWKNAPVLKHILYAQELRENLPASVVLGGIALKEEEDMTKEQLACALETRRLCAAECLFLAARDAQIGAAHALSVAAAACVDPRYGEESYAGAGMVIEGFDEVDDVFLLRIFQRHHGIPWTIARTERCIIRELTLADLDALFELYDRPGITCRMGPAGEYLPGYIEPLYPFEEEMEYQKNYIQYMYRCLGYGMWLVIERASGALIGRAGIENREYSHGVEMELGYLIHPAWQRQGIATEVCTAVIAYAEEQLDCGMLSLLTEEENVPSAALARKLGFVYAGQTDVSGRLTGRYVRYLRDGECRG